MYHRDSQVVVFGDKFRISDYHLDAVPVSRIVDITQLTSEHIPLVEALYKYGLESLAKFDIPLMRGKNLEEWVIAGYMITSFHLHFTGKLTTIFRFNVPVSVPYLHLVSSIISLKRIRIFFDY